MSVADGAPFRVLHVVAYFAPAFSYGGPPRSVLGLVRGLRAAGLEVAVYTTTAGGEAELPPTPEDGESVEGVVVRRFPRTFPRRFFASRGLVRAVDDALAGGRFDLVHLHGLWNAAISGAARRLRARGARYVVSPRGMLDAPSRAHHALRKRVSYPFVESRLLRAAAFLHATSEAEAAGLEALGLGRPVVTVPNGVGLPPLGEAAEEAARAFRARHGLAAGASAEPLVAFVGRLHPIKRLDLLVDAFARLHARRPTVRLAIAGPDEAGLRPALSARLGAAARAVLWLGAVEDDERDALLAASSALVLCSDSESFGRVVAEALAAAVPAVVTETCGWEALSRARCGLRVPQTAEALAEAFERLLDDPGEAREMGARGRAWVASSLSWDVAARTMADAYRKLR